MIEEFKPNYHIGETVIINGNEGRYISWKNSPGGLLWWIQDDTYIEIDSGTLTKGEMIKLAKTLK
mgnify:CR=1 FL=1